MKDFLDIFIFKPKKTERIILFILKVAFVVCYAIWIYELCGFVNIVEQITVFEKLKVFILEGHFILFIFLCLLLYFVFYKATVWIFEPIGRVCAFLLSAAVKIFLNALSFVIALIAWPFLKKFIFTIKWKITTNDLLEMPIKFFRWLFLKAGLLQTREQKIHSSKRARKMLAEIKTELVENGDRVLSKIHLRFVLTILLYCLYFYKIHDEYEAVPYLDRFIFWFCTINCIIQLIAYWFYIHFRVIYYLNLIMFRGIHREELAVEKAFENVLLELSDEVDKLEPESNHDTDKSEDDKIDK